MKCAENRNPNWRWVSNFGACHDINHWYNHPSKPLKLRGQWESILHSNRLPLLSEKLLLLADNLKALHRNWWIFNECNWIFAPFCVSTVFLVFFFRFRYFFGRWFVFRVALVFSLLLWYELFVVGCVHNASLFNLLHNFCWWFVSVLSPILGNHNGLKLLNVDGFEFIFVSLHFAGFFHCFVCMCVSFRLKKFAPIRLYPCMQYRIYKFCVSWTFFRQTNKKKWPFHFWLNKLLNYWFHINIILQLYFVFVNLLILFSTPKYVNAKISDANRNISPLLIDTAQRHWSKVVIISIARAKNKQNKLIYSNSRDRNSIPFIFAIKTKFTFS